MGVVYLTGVSGVGKTTVGVELRRRGYLVYDVDADRLARWFSNTTGAEVSMPAERDGTWFAENTYRLPLETVRRIATEAGERTAFITGAVGNENEIWDLFAKVVCLTVDAATLEHRLVQRGAFGSTPAELERVLHWHTRADTDNAGYGAHLISATTPPTNLAAQVLNALHPEH
ncbi:AAA family ATPase [Kribbella sp. NPDC048928]|uniref:AAA family ATPase n=1 Tax=Kribbella sp. NPDC048928 TaxID=3364111 RepID=UPI003723602D